MLPLRKKKPFASHYNQAVMEHTRIKLPGFGLPVNYYLEQGDLDAFPSSLNPSDLNEESRTV